MGSPWAARCFASNLAFYCSVPSTSKSMAPPSSLSLEDLAPFYLFLALPLFPLLLLTVSLCTRRRRFAKPTLVESKPEDKVRAAASSLSSLKLCLSKVMAKTHQTDRQKSSTLFPQSLLVELLPANSPKWDALFPSAQNGGDPGVNRSDLDELGGGCCGEKGEEEEEGRAGKRKKKKRRKKKNRNSLNFGDSKNDGAGEMRGENEEDGSKWKNKEDLVCLYPFTSSSSATQRKIKQHYDQLVKSHESKALTLAQVGHFVNSLVDAQNELQQKAETIQRKSTITKALLLRADRSSFDRLQQQLGKLELEKKRLEEDAVVYNWLQHQLKLSPAYKKILDIGATMETKGKASELVETADSSFSDISFEELLAQEKKDSFWQKHGKRRPCCSS